MPLLETKNKFLMPAAMALIFMGAWGSALTDGANGRAQQSAFYVVLLILGGICFLSDRIVQKRPVSISFLTLPFGIAWIFAVTKLIPFPLWLRSLLSPEITHRIETAREVLGEPYNRLMLNVLAAEPPGTAMRAMELLGAIIIVIVVADRLRNRRMQRLCMRALLFLGCFVCLTALAHNLLAAEKMWGQYITSTEIINFPLSNANHRATFYGILTLLLLAGGSMARARMERIYFFALAFVCTSFSFLCLSRAGIIMLVGILSTLGFLSWMLKAREIDTLEDLSEEYRHWTMPLAGFALLLVGLYVGWEWVSAEMTTLEKELNYSHKMHTLQSYINILPDTWLSGTGPFGLKNVFYHHITANDPGIHVYSKFNTAYFENAFFQIFADYGIPGAVIILASILWAAKKTTATRVLSWPILLVCGAVAFFFLTDLFDYFLEIGLGLWVLAFLCGMLGGMVGRLKPFSWKIKPEWATSVSIFVFVFSLPILIYSYQNDPQRLNLELLDTDKEEELIMASEAMARHPLDGFYPRLLAGNYRWHRNYERALEFANQSLYQKPIMAIVHREAAYINHRLGNKEKTLEHYRKSWKLEPTKGRQHLEWASQFTENTAELLAILPQFNARFLSEYCYFIGDKSQGKKTRACFDHVIQLPDASANHLVRAAKLAISAGDNEEARILMLERLGATPDYAPYQGILARIEQNILGSHEAYETSKTWPISMPESCPLLEWQFDATLALNMKDDAQQLLDKLQQCPNHRTMEQYAQIEMRFFDQFNEIGNSLRVLQKLNQHITPQVDYLSRQAEKELQLNLLSQAKSTFSRMKAVYPSHPNTTRIGEKIAQLEKKRQNRQLESWMRE